MGSRHQGSPIEANRLSNRIPEHKTKSGIRVLGQAAADRTRARPASAGTCRSTRGSSRSSAKTARKASMREPITTSTWPSTRADLPISRAKSAIKNSSVNTNCVTTCLKRMSSSTTHATFVEKDSTASRVTKNTKKRTRSKFCKRPVATVWSVA